MLDHEMIYKETEPLVGWWNPETECWEQEGISEVALERQESGSDKAFLPHHLPHHPWAATEPNAVLPVL